MGVNTDKPSRATIARRKNARERRTRVLADGGRRIELLLEAPAAKALDKLEATTGDSATAVVTGLLQATSRRK
ncbi:MAG TPA: hypothetical protein VGE09_11100 [Pseudoxanthomonas sp.]